MAEYIDRKKYMKDKYNCDLIHIESVELVPLYQIIDRLEQSIERAEYEKVLEENKQLKHIISDKVDKDLKCAFEVKELRSKIDKALEELRKEIEENHLNVIDYADGEWIVKDFVYGAIDRFKRNIGE